MSACLALIERPSSPKKRHLSLVPPRSSEIPAAWIVFAYNFNQEGQRINRRQIGAIGGAGTQSTAYTYDARLSLASSTRTGTAPGTTNYAFDSNINRTRDGSSTFAYEASNLIDSGGGQSFNHNAVGQITAQVSNGGSLNYQYNWNDQIKRVTGSVGVNYIYDGSGNRVSKQFDNNGAKTDYLWNGSEVLKEYNGDGSVKAQYLMGLGREGIKTGGKWSFYLNDALDSTYMLVDASGNVNGQWSYDDWGNSTTMSAPARTAYNPYLFQGQQFDAETGLYSMRARYYDPKTARFTSPDPIRLGGGRNMYSFAAGDPVNLTDPSGLQAWPRSFRRVNTTPPRRVVEHQMEGLGNIGADSFMFVGLAARDLIWLGRLAGGFAAVEGSEAIWMGAGKFIREAGSAVGTPQEEAFAAELVTQGRHVVSRFGLEGVDFIIEGEAWEYKGLKSFGDNTLKDAIETAVEENKASRIVIDARSFSTTDKFIEDQMNRLHGKGYFQQINQVMILTKDTVYRYGFK